MQLQIVTLAILLFVPNALGAFHLMTRYERAGTYSCDRGKTCYCDFNVEWRMGAVPSNQYNCNAFKDDRYFSKLISEGGGWTTSYPSICGSKPVNMYEINGGRNLEIWEANANPGKKIVTCYRQSENTIPCGNNGDPVCPSGKTELHDVWVCADTNLCN